MLIECPPPELKAKWGPLAHVTEQERKRILSLPYGGFKPAIKDIERQLKELAKKAKLAKRADTLRSLHRKQSGV